MAQVVRDRCKKLIKAAVEAARDNKVSPPPSVWLYRQCQAFGALPGAGGLNDQSYRELVQMRVLSSTFDAVQAWYSGRARPGDAASNIVLALAEDGLI